MAAAQRCGRSDALVGPSRRHPDVGDDDLGRQVLDRCLKRGEVIADTDEVQICGGLDHVPDAFTYEIVILGDQNADRHT